MKQGRGNQSERKPQESWELNGKTICSLLSAFFEIIRQEGKNVSEKFPELESNPKTFAYTGRCCASSPWWPPISSFIFNMNFGFQNFNTFLYTYSTILIAKMRTNLLKQNENGKKYMFYRRTHP